MKKILIIEDETAQQQAYKLKLEKDYELIFASTGPEALAATDSLPSLIILDIMLPGGQNGFDILQALKSNTKTKGIPVIMLTNLGDEEKNTALELGASEYINKTSIGPEQVAALVEKYILWLKS